MPNDRQQFSAYEPDRLVEVVREQIHHENELVNQRITWLIQSEGLLFAALAFAWEKSAKLSVLLAILGIATALSIGTAIFMYSPAVRGLVGEMPPDPTPSLSA
jgi:hypothetical protein